MGGCDEGDAVIEVFMFGKESVRDVNDPTKQLRTDVQLYSCVVLFYSTKITQISFMKTK